MLADPDRLIAEVFSRHLKPPERLTVDRFADLYRKVTPPSPRPGQWRTSTVPYLLEPMRSFTDPEVRQITLQFGTQSAKTELLLNCVAYAISQDPADAIIVIDNIKNVRQFSRSRVLKMLTSSPELAKHMSPKAWDTNLEGIALDGMNLWMTGSNSAGNLSNKPARFAFGDELDKWPVEIAGKGGREGAAIDLMRTRTDAFPDHKIVVVSSPTVEGLGISVEYTSSDQAVYQVPCPHCGQFQRLVFSMDGTGGVRWDGGVGVELTPIEHAEHRQRVRKTAWYECEHCEEVIENQHKFQMIRCGVWVRPKQRVLIDDGWLPKLVDPADPRTKENGFTVHRDHPNNRYDSWPAGVAIEGDMPETDNRGYQLSQLYSPFRTFGDIAEEFVRYYGEPPRTWFNTRLGEPYRPKGTRKDEHLILELAKDTPEGHTPYKVGVVPGPVSPEHRGTGPLVLIGAIDVQAEGVWYTVRGWGEMERSWLIEYGYVPCPSTQPNLMIDPETDEVVDITNGEVIQGRRAEEFRDNWAQVEALIAKRWPIQGDEKSGSMDVRWWAIDAGFRSWEVYRLVRRMPDRIMAVKGRATMPSPWKVYTAEEVEGDRVHEARGRGVAGEILMVHTDYWKEYVHGHLELRPPMFGAWHWPIDLTQEYPHHITAEELVTKPSARGIDRKWQLRPGRKDNHLLDTEVYGCALADHLGVRDLRAEDLEVRHGEDEEAMPFGGIRL